MIKAIVDMLRQSTKYCLLLMVCLWLTSCRNYETEAYYAAEEEAYEQLITAFTNSEYMLSTNEHWIDRPTLYIITELDNQVDIGHISQIPIYENEEYLIENHIEERKLFRPLTTGKLNKRTLKNALSTPTLDLQLLPFEEFEDEHEGRLLERTENNPSLFGYLFLTRIYFNREFTLGYMSYSFYCGASCAWNNNVEIRKVNGQWQITRTFSGGIA